MAVKLWFGLLNTLLLFIGSGSAGYCYLSPQNRNIWWGFKLVGVFMDSFNGISHTSASTSLLEGDLTVNNSPENETW